MRKLRLLLLDANVVIELFEQGIWEKVVARCEVYLARTVVEEAQHVPDEEPGFAQQIDLANDIAGGQVTVIDVEASRLKDFRDRFGVGYFERLDPGELESLVYLDSSEESFLMCSADSIVFRVLGRLQRGDQGISLEETLGEIGLGRTLERQFGKDFREHWTGIGRQDLIQGSGMV